MLVEKSISMPWWEKYMLTIEEASAYFGVGENALRRFIKQHEDEQFVVYIGAKVLIKRKLFCEYIDKTVNVF